MVTQSSFSLVFNLFLLLINLLLFATAAQYLLLKPQLQNILTDPTPQAIAYVSFVINNEAAIYFTAASLTSLACFYNILVSPRYGKGVVSCSVDFYLTLGAACMQVGVGVLSGISTVLFQENFTAGIENLPELNSLQLLLLGCLYSILCLGVPMLGFLLYEKWSALAVCWKNPVEASQSVLESSVKRY